MRRRSATYALTVTLCLATTALAQSDGPYTYPLCWHSCVETQQPSCSASDTNISCTIPSLLSRNNLKSITTETDFHVLTGLCRLASDSSLQSSFLYCLEKNCNTADATSPFEHLGRTCSGTGSAILTSVVASISAAVATADISDDSVTATGLTRPHGAARSSRIAVSASAAAGAMTDVTTTQSGDGSTVIVGATSSAVGIVTAISTSSSSTSSATAKTTQNGGTVLDQAGSGSMRIQAGSLWALGCVFIVAWLWW